MRGSGNFPFFPSPSKWIQSRADVSIKAARKTALEGLHCDQEIGGGGRRGGDEKRVFGGGGRREEGGRRGKHYYYYERTETADSPAWLIPL